MCSSPLFTSSLLSRQCEIYLINKCLSDLILDLAGISMPCEVISSFSYIYNVLLIDSSCCISNLFASCNLIILSSLLEVILVSSICISLTIFATFTSPDREVFVASPEWEVPVTKKPRFFSVSFVRLLFECLLII